MSKEKKTVVSEEVKEEARKLSMEELGQVTGGVACSGGVETKEREDRVSAAGGEDAAGISKGRKSPF